MKLIFAVTLIFLIGDIEPEHEGLLIEHGFDSSDFSDDVIACLPQVDPEKGFVIPDEEIEKRYAYGIRDSYVMFPKVVWSNYQSTWCTAYLYLIIFVFGKKCYVHCKLNSE